MGCQTCLLLSDLITQYNSIQETQNVFFCGIHREISQLLLCLLSSMLLYVLIRVNPLSSEYIIDVTHDQITILIAL